VNPKSLSPRQHPIEKDVAGFREASQRLVSATAEATASSTNEANLRHAIEAALERECAVLGIVWTPYQLERALRNETGQVGFADVVHGAVIIEYEPPASFGGREGAALSHAKFQAVEYASRMAREEGRPISDYVLVAWDGAHICFGETDGGVAHWERLERFGLENAERLLRLLRDQGMPLVHPAILKAIVGPDSPVGGSLIPGLFRAIVAATRPDRGERGQTKTTLLFTEWGRLFGQAVGIETDRLEGYLKQQSASHGVSYSADIPAYLFALHTYIATVAKLVAAYSLPNPSQNIADGNVPLKQRLQVLESGRLFKDAGIANMLSGDFFSWYVDDASWDIIEPSLADLLNRLRGVSFDLAHKVPESVRDLFKGLYEIFVPRELRHALGEVYTPDWLAAHAFDQIGWSPENDLLDPTCGTGTFLLEAVKRRLIAAQERGERLTVERALSGVHGIDLNPLAVLGAKASLVVVLASTLDPNRPVVLPVYLADAINSAEPTADSFFVHELQTELGRKRFEIPATLVQSPILYSVFDAIRALVDADRSAPEILEGIKPLVASLGLSEEAVQRVENTIGVFVDLHKQGWNGIWAPILADRFAAGAIRPVSHIAGNPPWVKWSHLPPAYAEFIKPLCRAMNVFSKDRYVGGIESDISTVITFAAIRKWLAPDGELAFFITATVFNNESSQGFRRFEYNDGEPMAAVQLVEDYKALAPFEGVTNHPALLVLKKGRATEYPVQYCIWSPGVDGKAGQQFPDSESFRAAARQRCLWARPVPGTDSGPWLKGSAEEHEVWSSIFDASADSYYRARKGITTDLNGVYFVRVQPIKHGENDTVWIQNDPAMGRNLEIPQVRRLIEKTHVFPLMRGRGLSPFKAQLDPEFMVIVPQRSMHGDENLLLTAPRTYGFLSTFEDALRQRGSYRKYQKDKAFWSTWSTGAYTFSPYKVLWKEMRGKHFCAAYVGPQNDPVLGVRPVVPDHKLYFVPVETLDEAAYLTAILNAPVVAAAVSAYAAQLSLGVSVIENLKLPKFNPDEPDHQALARIAQEVTERDGAISDNETAELDRIAFRVVSEHE
jgi:Putative RNA methylase family UPF0020